MLTQEHYQVRRLLTDLKRQGCLSSSFKDKEEQTVEKKDDNNSKKNTDKLGRMGRLLVPILIDNQQINTIPTCRIPLYRGSNSS